MSIVIPAAETVKIGELRTDGENPNKMSREQLERLKASIKKWGFIVPIITNKDLLIADGEQRYTAAQALGMTEVSVIRLPVEDVDRRLLRQVLNKLKGKHEKELDQAEYERIIQAGKEEDLKIPAYAVG
jgi:ParB-like chromosome segregation protein Spo0J